MGLISSATGTDSKVPLTRNTRSAVCPLDLLAEPLGGRFHIRDRLGADLDGERLENAKHIGVEFGAFLRGPIPLYFLPARAGAGPAAVRVGEARSRGLRSSRDFQCEKYGLRTILFT